MKWVIILLFFLVTLVGCEETTLLVEEPVVKKVTINASILGVGGVVDPVGEMKIEKFNGAILYTIFLEKNYDVLSIVVNGVDKVSELKDSKIKVGNLASESNTIIFDFEKKDLISIKKNPWVLKAMETYAEDSLLFCVDLTVEEQTALHIFTDKTWIIRSINGRESIVNLEYYYDESGKMTHLGSTSDKHEVYKLEGNTLILRKYLGTNKGKKNYSVHTYQSK